MMHKSFSLHGKTASGRPLIHLVEPGTRYGLRESEGLEKTASGEHLPAVVELIESLEPQPGRLYLVNSALGAGEFVGFNLRGDWFTEEGLLHTPRGWHDIPVWDIATRRHAAAVTEPVQGWGDLAWGYPTFYNAHRFRHHVNKDPKKAYGFVLGAFWDPRMRRVVLVSELIRDNCTQLGALDVYERIARGEFPDTSMGAKVPYDRCSICNHAARFPKEYCEHVRADALPPYGMRVILPDGRRCGVYNDYPRFFDDSFVFIGAERSAKVMANVTDRVRGRNTYGNQVYLPLVRAGTKAASAPLTEIAEEEVELGHALAHAATPPTGASARDVSSRLRSILSMVPVLSKQEQAALKFVETSEMKRAAIRDGGLSSTELRLWSSRELQRLQKDGVGPELIDRARALVQHHMHHAFGDKLATAAKWAEHLKNIPAPSTTQRALLRDHEGRLAEIPRAPVLNAVAERPAVGLSNLAHLGIVLRPEEFQYCVLRAAGCDADAYADSGAVFRPVPLNMAQPARWRPQLRPSGLSDLVSLLGPLLAGRSFAPQAVRIRVVTPPPARVSPPLEVVDDAALNKVAQLYNNYRIGILAHAPDWGYVSQNLPAGALDATTKMGQIPDAMSEYLLRLAYWPSVPIV